MAKKVKVKKSKTSKTTAKPNAVSFYPIMTRYPTPLRLDLGCGEQKLEGYFGIDIRRLKKVDLVYDLEKFPWPFEDNSVSEAVCSHYIEHTKDIIKFMDEVYRILKPGALFTVLAPYYTSVRAQQDPTHTREISEGTFMYFSKKWRDLNHLSYYPIKSDFEFSYSLQFHEEWINRADEARNFAMRHYTNVVGDIQVMLIKQAPKKKTSLKKKSS